MTDKVSILACSTCHKEMEYRGPSSMQCCSEKCYAIWKEEWRRENTGAARIADLYAGRMENPNDKTIP